MTDSLARARELVTPKMMSEVFAASVQRQDPDHPHLYDHRIGAEKMNELLKPLLDTAVREAPQIKEGTQDCGHGEDFEVWWTEHRVASTVRCWFCVACEYARLRSLKEGQHEL